MFRWWKERVHYQITSNAKHLRGPLKAEMNSETFSNSCVNWQLLDNVSNYVLATSLRFSCLAILKMLPALASFQRSACHSINSNQAFDICFAYFHSLHSSQLCRNIFLTRDASSFRLISSRNFMNMICSEIYRCFLQVFPSND